MDPLKQAMSLLRTYKCRLLRRSGTGHEVYRLPNGNNFTLYGPHRNRSGDRNGHANNLSELKRLLGIGAPAKPAEPAPRSPRKLRPRPMNAAPVEISVPTPPAPAPAPPPGPPPEQIMAPRITFADNTAEPGEAAPMSRINYSTVTTPASATRDYHEPSGKSGECRSLPKEVIDAANRELQETGKTTLLRRGSEEILAAINGDPVDSILHRTAPNILDLKTQYESLRTNADEGKFIRNALMFLCEFASDMRGQLARAADVRPPAPRIEMPAPISTNGNGNGNGHKRK